MAALQILAITGKYAGAIVGRIKVINALERS
jgi:hypothetical protein